MSRLDTPLTVRYGTPRQRPYAKERAKRGEPVLDRIMRHIEVAPSGCWEWQLSPIKGTGYAGITIDYKSYRVHRLTYELFVGPIAEGLHIDHLCRNRICVNPEHLEAVTPRINYLRGTGVAARNAIKTHCNRGHEYDEENTYLHKGRRYCRACQRINKDNFNARRASKRAAA